MPVQHQVVSILTEVLQLNSGIVSSMTMDTHLLGAIPEFDSMAVVSILTALEEHYGFLVEDDEIDADVFETVGTLVKLVEQKLNKS
jgi:acyl carrier protein